MSPIIAETTDLLETLGPMIFVTGSGVALWIAIVRLMILTD